MRLDQFLVKNGLIKSRERAKEFIENGNVVVNGEVAVKASILVSDIDKIELKKQDFEWVARSALKLLHALDYFKIDVKGKTCLDIGASTGGFTQVLLKKGARKVYALDVGHSQLASEIALDKRVQNMEGVNIKNVSESFFSEKIDFICIDVSFISLESVLPVAKNILTRGGQIVALIKPQFEVGKGQTKNGLVKDKELHKEVISKIKNVGQTVNLKEIGICASPILGGKGNKEFLIGFIKD